MVHFRPRTIALFAAGKQIRNIIGQPVVTAMFVVFFDFLFWTVMLNVSGADGQGTTLTVGALVVREGEQVLFQFAPDGTDKDVFVALFLCQESAFRLVTGFRRPLTEFVIVYFLNRIPLVEQTLTDFCFGRSVFQANIYVSAGVPDLTSKVWFY